MRNKIFKWVILIALLAYLAVMAVWANRRVADSRCTGIEVSIEGQRFLGDSITRVGIISELARFDKNIMNKRLDEINTRSIENFLGRFSNFESVQCAITSTGRLRISVVPMVPELRVFDGGSSYYINKDGKRIEANAKFFTDVPIVAGHFTEKFPASRLVPLVHYIQNDPTLRSLVMMIKVDSPHDIILIPRITGHVINIGDTGNLPRKFGNLLLAYRGIMPYKGWQTYDTISVKFLSRIVATRRDKTILSHTPEFEESIDFDEDANSAYGGENSTPESGVAKQSRGDIPRNFRRADEPGSKPEAKPDEKKPEAPKEQPRKEEPKKKETKQAT